MYNCTVSCAIFVTVVMNHVASTKGRSISYASSFFPGSGPPGLDALAPRHMVWIRNNLTFDAAVPIEMTIAAPLGGNSNLVGTGRVGAGLG